MKQRKNYVVLFPIFENIHLTTEIGQIAYFLYKEHGFSSKIAGYKNSESYPGLTEEVKGLQLEFIENKGRFSFLEKGVLSYLKKNAKKIDVLTLYHFSKFTLIYGWVYKFYNPKGFFYIKLDGYNETFAEGKQIVHSTNKLKNVFFKLIEKIASKKIDLMTMENKEGVVLVRKMFPKLSGKIEYIPVGANNIYLDDKFKNQFKPFTEKENIFLSLGRVGEWIKNHEMIVRALCQTDMKGWKFVFVGPVNDDFKIYFENICKTHPQLKESVLFTGRITDRATLYEWYNRSKVFCMTSRHESFCHAIAESFYFGNYIIGTEGIMSMKDVTDSGKYGVTLKNDDDTALSKVFQQIINDDSSIAATFEARLKHSRANFTWSPIVNNLNQYLQRENQ